jgi:hypothetical protein
MICVHCYDDAHYDGLGMVIKHPFKLGQYLPDCKDAIAEKEALKALAERYPYCPRPGCVPALYTYYKGTTIPKIICASNDYNKILKAAAQIEIDHELYVEECTKMIEEADLSTYEFENKETFDLFAYGTKNAITGFETIDDAVEKQQELKEEENYTVVYISENKDSCHATPYGEIELFYTKDIYTKEEAVEALAVNPKLWVAPLLII